MNTVDEQMLEAHKDLEQVFFFQFEEDFEDTLGGESPLIS